MKQNLLPVYIGGGVVVLGLAAWMVVTQVSLNKVQPASDGTPEQQQAVAALLTEVSQLMVLPTGEEPTVATVVDPQKLQSQPFFASTKVDDRVLIYINARKAILYRPSEKRIIEVAPLLIGDPSAVKSQ